MRSPDAAPSASSPSHRTGYAANRSILNRINSLNVAMQAEQQQQQQQQQQQPTASTSATGQAPTSPATGANALPASPPLTLPSINRFSRSLGPAPSLSPPDGSQDALDILRLSFESPAEAAARTSSTPPPLSSLVKASSSSTLPQPMIDGPLFAPEHDRNFPVPKYLDHSVFRSRMFTYPSPLRSPVIARHTPRASTYQAASNYSLLGPETRAPAAGSSRKSQLAASLASSAGQTDREDWSIPLPTCWDQEDRCSLVEVSGDGLEVSFCGSGKNGDRDAAAVRANRHMPPHTGVYYYEVEIVSKGQSGYIAIGFSGLNVSLSRLPGWEANSWGYHGDDGHSFASQGTGRAYGPTFSTGDVVGCGIDFTHSRAFFTKNGAFLGHVFENLDGHQLYPSVGMRTPGEVVRANFGQAQFRFDIEQFVVARKLKLLRGIDEAHVPSRYLLPIPVSEMMGEELPSVEAAMDMAPGGADWRASTATDETVASLVSAYLTFHGFVDTANAFDAQRSSRRKRYSSLAEASTLAVVDVEMDVDDAAAATSSAEIDVRQRVCRAVMAGRPDEALTDLESSSLSSTTLNDAVFHLRCQHFIELLVAASPSSTAGKGKARSASPPGLDEALDYGQQLDATYAADERPVVREGLRRAFALLAYDDPRRAEDAEVAWLASQAARDKLADELNAAILDAQGQSARPVLESVYKQACVAVGELGRLGSGAAALVDVPAEALL